LGNLYGPKEGINSMVGITLESKTFFNNPIIPETMKELNDNGPSFHIWPVIFVHVSYHHQSCILITALLTTMVMLSPRKQSKHEQNLKEE
jgi:hypothetical protein